MNDLNSIRLESWGRFSYPRDFVTGPCSGKKGAMKKLSSLLHSNDFNNLARQLCEPLKDVVLMEVCED